jgi:predicted RNA-binding protein with PIN domain
VKDLLIVDGYNIIYNWEELAGRAQQDFEWSRLELIAILEDYAGFSGKDVLLVFDGSAPERSFQRKGPLEIVYTAAEETADQYIERVVQEHKDAGSGVSISVATSDGAQQSMVLGLGASRIPVRELRLMVGRAKAGQRGVAQGLKRRTPLESRVDPGVYEKLEKMRRGIKKDE